MKSLSTECKGHEKTNGARDEGGKVKIKKKKISHKII